jgi:hypothetical protein
MLAKIEPKPRRLQSAVAAAAIQRNALLLATARPTIATTPTKLKT